MTNRHYIRPYSAGLAIKRPRLRRVEIGLEGPPPPTPEGISNGFRPHGGYRGMSKHPPGQFSFDKDESYSNDINDEFQVLLNQENKENHGAPYWVGDVQREITHSGESPLFTNKLLATGKFEQEHGVITMERALLPTKPRRLMSAPRPRHLNGVKEFYRPNSTHQYLSATDLRNMEDNEEVMVKYGRPTRTTLLRARQRSNSAINAYDLRRQANKRMEEVKNNTIFYTAKESFDREQSRISIRYINIYQSDGETMHSFLTGARYNRAHLLDSKGLSVYGVYMPRENPTECFITSNRRMKDVGDEIPSAPPDSPRSDVDENSVVHQSRPTSSTRHSVTSRATSSRPGSSRPISKTTSSRPPSNRRVTPQTASSRPRSAKDPGTTSSPVSQNARPHPPRSADSNRRELPLPDEVTMAMPDHVNKGKAGVYVTLKGQKIIESVESKLPRVTGVSLPKIRNKSRDFMDEIQLVNQPPPTPVEPSVISMEKNKLEYDGDENRNRLTINRTVEGQVGDNVGLGVNNDDNNVNKVNEENALGEVVIKENPIDERKTMEIRPAKHVNFIGVREDSTIESEKEMKEDVQNGQEQSSENETAKQENVDEDIKPETNENVRSNDNNESDQSNMLEDNDQIDVDRTDKTMVNESEGENVVFFVTEEGKDGGDDTDKVNTHEEMTESNADDSGNKEGEGDINEMNDNESKGVDDIIKVKISETEQSKDNVDNQLEENIPLSSRDYPFTDNENQ